MTIDSDLFKAADFLNIDPIFSELNNVTIAENNISVNNFGKLLKCKKIGNDLVIVNYNIRRLQNREHFDSLINFLATINANNHNIDCLIITDTWTDLTNVEAGCFDIPGFILYTDCRIATRGGGVAV